MHDCLALFRGILHRLIPYIYLFVIVCVWPALLFDKGCASMNMTVVALFAIFLVLIVGLFVKE